MTLASLVAGFVDAIAGGGGVVTFPVFLYFGLPVPVIAATNKLAGTCGVVVSALTYHRDGRVDGRVVKVAWPFVAVGSALGAAALSQVPNDFLKPIVSVLILLVAGYCFFRPEMGIRGDFHGLTPGTRALLVGCGLGIGFYDGFFGPGTGVFLAFLMIQGLGMDFLGATASTKVLNFVTNLAALALFATRGHIRFDIGVPMAVANVAGAYLGAKLAIVKGSGFVRWVYVVMAAAVAVRLTLG